MDTLLIAGLDTVVGTNLAARLVDRYRIIGVCLDEPVSLDGCHSGQCRGQDENDINEWVESIRPTQLVYCGPSSVSTWDDAATRRPDVESVDVAGHWAAAARDYGARFTLVSSDAVFTGPWIFHDEDSACVCSSPQARAARRAEKLAARQCPGALIVRTNVFGWSHGYGWVERTVDRLETETSGPFDFQRHATPILATDFAGILDRCWQMHLDGVYHVAGTERINPNQFVRKLADEFGLPSPEPVDGNRLMDRPAGYGRGETSLHTTRIRKALGIPMPTASDGLIRLREQKLNGFGDSLKMPMVLEPAA